MSAASPLPSRSGPSLKIVMFLCASGSKKGFSPHQLHRTLGVTLKTAWFMGHRIREAMREGNLAPFGSNGGTVEVDENLIGNEANMPKNVDWAQAQGSF